MIMELDFITKHTTLTSSAQERQNTQTEKKPTNGTKNRDGLAISCHL